MSNDMRGLARLEDTFAMKDGESAIRLLVPFSRAAGESYCIGELGRISEFVRGDWPGTAAVTLVEAWIVGVPEFERDGVKVFCFSRGPPLDVVSTL
jgi:hypothetical protein